ncbi:hypothetical protein BH09PLA1_BH09PLA1_19420 [soil metagenome]
MPADSETGETTYLQREARQAKQAMSHAVSAATRDLAHSIDPRTWTAAHPWIAMSTAAVGGFVAASKVVPSRDEEWRDKLQQIREAVIGEPRRDRSEDSRADSADEKPGKSKTRSILGIIGTEFLRYAGPAITTALSAALAGKSAQEAADGDGIHAADVSAGASDPASSI